MAISRRKLKSNQIKIQNIPSPEGAVSALGFDTNGSIVEYDMSTILNAITIHPDYVSPSASITNVNQTKEVGELIDLSLTITYTQNDGGSATSYTLNSYVNNVGPTLVSNTQTTSITDLKVIDGTIGYEGVVSHDEGPVKENNIGELDPIGRIEAGSVTSSRTNIIGRYKFFFGNTPSVPIDSATTRSLPQNSFENNSSIDLITGVTNTDFVVAIPVDKSITQVNDLTNLNADLTLNYVLTDSSFVVNDAEGLPVTYKLYVYSTAVPYSVSATHRILIS